MHEASTALDGLPILLPSLLSAPSQAWCLSLVWFGSRTQSAGHRFLLKPTKPDIWPRGDDDLAISERISTSLELGHLTGQLNLRDSEMIISLTRQITERQGTAMYNPTVNRDTHEWTLCPISHPISIFYLGLTHLSVDFLVTFFMTDDNRMTINWV